MANKSLLKIPTGALRQHRRVVAASTSRAGRQDAIKLFDQANIACRCCPAEYACVAPANANGLIGCCPSGNTCGGVVNLAQVTTVTVQAYVAPQPTVVVHNNPDPVQDGFCATITMNGPGLPKAEQGSCGTILIVSDGASLNTWSIGVGFTAELLHLAL